MKCLIMVAALMLSAPALAQSTSSPDPAFIQKAIAEVQAQRNAALDAQAALGARLNMVTEERDALKKQVEKLTKVPAVEPKKD